MPQRVNDFNWFSPRQPNAAASRICAAVTSSQRQTIVVSSSTRGRGAYKVSSNGRDRELPRPRGAQWGRGGIARCDVDPTEGFRDAHAAMRPDSAATRAPPMPAPSPATTIFGNEVTPHASDRRFPAVLACIPFMCAAERPGDLNGWDDAVVQQQQIGGFPRSRPPARKRDALQHAVAFRVQSSGAQPWHAGAGDLAAPRQALGDVVERAECHWQMRQRAQRRGAVGQIEDAGIRPPARNACTA